MQSVYAVPPKQTAREAQPVLYGRAAVGVHRKHDYEIVVGKRALDKKQL